MEFACGSCSPPSLLRRRGGWTRVAAWPRPASPRRHLPGWPPAACRPLVALVRPCPAAFFSGPPCGCQNVPSGRTGGGVLVEAAVRQRRRSADLVDDVVFGLVVLREPHLASARVLVEVLVLHGGRGTFERRLRVLDLVRPRSRHRGCRSRCRGSRRRSSRRPGSARGGSRRRGHPHQTDARTGGDDPLRRSIGLELDDLHVLGLRP